VADTVLDEEAADAHVPHAFCARTTVIAHQQDGALVALVQNHVICTHIPSPQVKFIVHIVCGMTSHAPMTSLSTELQAMSHPTPMDMVPLV